jgi:hypothetical protein
LKKVRENGFRIRYSISPQRAQRTRGLLYDL